MQADRRRRSGSGPGPRRLRGRAVRGFARDVQQRRHRRIVCTVSRRRLRRLRARHGREHPRRDGGEPTRGATHGAQRWWRDPQHDVDRRDQRGGRRDGLPRDEGRGDPFHAVDRGRARATRHPRELHRARAHTHGHQCRDGPVVDRARDAAAAARGIAARRRRGVPVSRERPGRPGHRGRVACRRRDDRGLTSSFRQGPHGPARRADDDAHRSARPRRSRALRSPRVSPRRVGAPARRGTRRA